MLFGRAAECGLIEQALAEARAGSSRVVLVRGEPGIGKSALLRHASEKSDGMRVLAARGIATVTAEPSPFDSAGLPALELRGLEADAASMLLVDQAGRAVPAETCEWLYRSTAGNPLALIELAAEAPYLGVELFDRPVAVET